MSSVRFRRISAAAAAVTAVLLFSGCATGTNAQTNQQYDAGVGSNSRGPHIQILNGLFVDNGDETATFSASLLNRDAESHTLTGADVTGASGAAIATRFTTSQKLKKGIPFLPGINGDIMLTGAFPAGGFVKITLNFDNAAPVTLNVPIVTRTPMYDSVAKVPVAIVCAKPIKQLGQEHRC